MVICRLWCIKTVHSMPTLPSKARSTPLPLRLPPIRLESAGSKIWHWTIFFVWRNPAAWAHHISEVIWASDFPNRSNIFRSAVLQDAVIFRVARILEDFHRECAIERVYLSGGLSELICLQQGIAQCVPFDVYRLAQGESSLKGAALLATGMACHRKSARISIAGNPQALQRKYLRWKAWLDDLLV